MSQVIRFLASSTAKTLDYYCHFDDELWGSLGSSGTGEVNLVFSPGAFDANRAALGRHYIYIRANDGSSYSNTIDVSYIMGHDTGLSVWEIVGIVLGALAAVALIGGGIWWYHKHRKAKNIASATSLAPDHLLDPRVAGYPDQAGYIGGKATPYSPPPAPLMPPGAYPPAPPQGPFPPPFPVHPEGPHDHAGRQPSPYGAPGGQGV
jgi:hypothetical protein